MSMKLPNARTARQMARDWNRLSAAIKLHAPPEWVPGQQVSGEYLAQPFTATILTATQNTPGWFRLSLDLHEAVDVVTFDSFSSWRKRINGTIGPKGHSREKTSDGAPQLILAL